MCYHEDEGYLMDILFPRIFTLVCFPNSLPETERETQREGERNIYHGQDVLPFHYKGIDLPWLYGHAAVIDADGSFVSMARTISSHENNNGNHAEINRRAVVIVFFVVVLVILFIV
jgi:hypothetical protein